MPAIKLDVALLHVNKSDEKGNTQIIGSDPFFDDLLQELLRKHLFHQKSYYLPKSLGGKDGAIFNRFERSLLLEWFILLVVPIQHHARLIMVLI